MSPTALSAPGSRSSTAGKSSSRASCKFACLVQLASQRYCQAEYASNNAVIVSDSTRNAAINSFDVDVEDASGTVFASAEDKKDETGNTGKRAGSATNKTSGHPGRDHVCDTCNRTFTYKSSLKRHIIAIHSDSSSYFKCDSCKAKFPRRDMLNIHKERMHSDNPPSFECEICKKTYWHISSLNRHTSLTHPDIPVFRCSVCRKTFGDNDQLIRHERVHSDCKPFVCEICHKRFSHKRSMKFHQKKCE